MRTFEVVANQAFTSLALAESAQRGYVAIGLPELKSVVPDQLAATKEFLQRAELLSRRDSVIERRFPRLESAFGSKISWMDRVRAQYESDPKNAAEMIRTGHGKKLMDGVEACLADLNQTETEVLGEESARARLYTRVDVFSSFLFVGVSVFLTLLLLRQWRRIDAAESDVKRLREERTANLEQEVSRRTAQLQLVNGDLEAFSSVSAHTIGRELAELSSNLRQIEETPEASSILEGARSHIGQLEQTLGLIQQLSKLSRERSPNALVDLAELVRSAIEAKQAAQPLTDLKLALPDHLPAQANERGMRILFRALIDAAWPSMRNEASPSLELSCDEADGRQVFAFRYGSQGQVPIDLMTLFTTQAEQGDRLLSIAAAIALRVIQRIGGEFWYDAVPGRRTCFYFTLGSAKE